jgi:excisionase family DNA binding protein
MSIALVESRPPTTEEIAADGAVGVIEAAAFLGVGQSLVWKLIREGQLPTAKIFRRTVIPRAALRAFLASKLEAAK